MLKTFTKTFQISSFDLNPNAVSRITALANYLQEMATEHAELLGWGYHDMQKKNTAWVLSRFHVKIHRQPGWNENISIDTWPRGVERLFAMRDFKVKDEAGMTIADATTYWLIIDRDSHRPVRVSEDVLKIESRPDTEFPEPLGKIEFPELYQEVYHRTASYSDLDIMGHVNNVSYLSWCLDAIPLEVHLKHEAKGFEINFLSEAKYGDPITINMAKGEKNTYLLNAVNTKTDKECVRARIIYK